MNILVSLVTFFLTGSIVCAVVALCVFVVLDELVE